MGWKESLKGALQLTPKQVECLVSPIRLELVEALGALGPSSAGELAAHLRRSPGSVFHQVGLLQRAGLLRAARQRPTTRRPETVYELAAPRFAVVGHGSARGNLQAARAVRAILRRATREADSFLKRNQHHAPATFHGAQLTAALAPAAQQKLLRHLNAIEALLRRANRRGDPDAQIFSWTSVLVPLARQRRKDARVD